MQHQEAFIEHIKEHEALIYKITKVYTDSREDEQDLYQEIVYQLWKSFPDFRNESRISTWMYRVAVRYVFRHYLKTASEAENIFKELDIK